MMYWHLGEGGVVGVFGCHDPVFDRLGPATDSNGAGEIGKVSRHEASCPRERNTVCIDWRVISFLDFALTVETRVPRPRWAFKVQESIKTT